MTKDPLCREAHARLCQALYILRGRLASPPFRHISYLPDPPPVGVGTRPGNRQSPALFSCYRFSFHQCPVARDYGLVARYEIRPFVRRIIKGIDGRMEGEGVLLRLGDQNKARLIGGNRSQHEPPLMEVRSFPNRPYWATPLPTDEISTLPFRLFAWNSRVIPRLVAPGLMMYLKV